MTDIPAIGANLARLRRQAGLSQQGLALRAGVSLDLVKKLEQGRRHSCSLPTVHALASVLDVDPGTVLGRPTPLPDAGPFSGAVAIRRALTSVEDLIGTADSVDPWTLDQGRRTVAHLWSAYWAGHYEALGRLLPSGIAQARATTRAVPDNQRAEAHDLAAQIHQVAACTLVHLGYGDVSHLALREGLRLAEHGHDPLRVTSLQGSLAWLLLNQGRARESQELAAAVAAGLQPGQGDTAARAMYGSMLLTAANAAGRAGDRAGAQPLLDEAGDVAQQVGNRLDYQTPFGPDQHLMQTVDVDIVTESYPEALTTAGRMPPTPDLPQAARARHLSDVALAHLRMGHDAQAVDVLLRIEDQAPSWMRFQSQPRMVIADLRRRAANPPALTALAERVGVVSPAEPPNE